MQLLTWHVPQQDCHGAVRQIKHLACTEPQPITEPQRGGHTLGGMLYVRFMSSCKPHLVLVIYCLQPFCCDCLGPFCCDCLGPFCYALKHYPK
jgi:hypothetical protein